ncbi:MAG: hypothetical protein AAB510_00250 [Patescibacteria group bacterium]
MGFFGETKTNEELILVFDIRSSSVGAAFFYTDKNQKSRIIMSVSEPIPAEDKGDIDRFLFLTMKALEVVVGRIIVKGLGAPDKIFCVLSLPWYISESRVVSLKKDTPFLFTPKVADSLIEQEVALVKEKYLKMYTDIGDSLRSIELKNVKITMNGYEVSNPINKHAKEVEMNLFISLSAEKICKKIEETIATHFSSRQIKFSPFSMAAFSVVRDIFSDFLVINIGGEITDISMVKGSTLRESISFPIGTNSMTRGVASSMKCTLDEARSFVSIFKDSHASPSLIATLEPIMKKLKAEWLVKFQESLANISNDISVPALLYITIDSDLEELFRELITTEQFNQYTLTESKFQLVFLNIETLRNFIVFERDVPFNSYLVIDAIYINHFLTNPKTYA